jgi:hypothetical protein
VGSWDRVRDFSYADSNNPGGPTTRRGARSIGAVSVADHQPADPAAPFAAAGAPSRARWLAPAVTIGAVACGCALTAAWNPGDAGVPLCASQSVFGVDCPFCGGMRCVNALTRGDWLAAADHNVLLAIALPLTAVGLLAWLWRSWRGRPTPVPWPSSTRASIALGTVVVVALAAFTVARNVGGPAWADWLASTSSG